MTAPGFLRKWFPPLLLLAALWLVLVILFAGQFIIAGSQEWEEAVERSVGFWLVWLPLLPLTAWLARRFPLERRRPVLSIAVHLVACVAVVLICQEFTPGRQQPSRDRDGGPPREGAPSPARQPENSGPAREGGPPPWSRGPRSGPPGEGRPSMRPRGIFGPQAFRVLLDVLVYGGVVSLTHTIALLRRSRQRERRALELEASLSRARLEALRLQINPHFLFNTLNAISSLIHTRPDTADEMTGSLSELLRASLQGSGDHEVTLRQEMELLRLFTDIERTRFGDRIAFQEDIASDTLVAMVPSLVLQPLVENAIRHGLEPRVENGTVTIAARRGGDRLHLTVSDDGVGFSGKENSASDGPGGIGLTNTRDRLRALYGDAHDLTIAPGIAGGTVISITIPFRTE